MIYLIDPNIVGSVCTRYCGTKCSPKFVPLYGTPV